MVYNMTMKYNNLSYETYLKNELEGLSKNFSMKSYKLASQEEWQGFERGKDIRVQIQWKGNCIWEWILEKTFWYQTNTNKEDRTWMRNHADIKIERCKMALVKKPPITKNKRKVGSTQLLFEEMKKQK